MTPSKTFIFLFFSLSLSFTSFLPPLTSGYNEVQAREFWYYQVAALCSSDRLLSWNVSTVSDLYPQIQEIQVFEKDSNLAYTAYNPTENLIWMVFRRTINVENMIEDVDIFLIDYEECDGCLVHSGFYGAYLNVRDGVMGSFRRLREKYPSAKTAVIGHSLGAAMSTFGFVDAAKISKIDYFYTFGSPRVGNQNVADYINSLPTTIGRARITHHEDATPHLPFNFMGYFHVGHEIFYDEESVSYLVCNEIKEDDNCSLQFGIFELSTHDHVNYMGFDHEVYSATCQ